MHLFKNRPLALVCAIIIFVSLVAFRVSVYAKIILGAVALLTFAVFFVMAQRVPRLKVKSVFICFCAVCALLAIASQFFGVDIKEMRARAYEGEHNCEVLILDETADGTSFDSYSVILRDIDDKRVSFDVTLYLFFESELKSGDIVRLHGEISEVGAVYSTYDDGAQMDILVYNMGECVLISENALSVKARFFDFRHRVAEYLDMSFGEECGALARGIFLGDTDGISKDLIRDFRRAGAAHLLAVSGLHISMLIAMAEIVLWCFAIGKRVRCAMLCVLAVVFLGMTGFAMSACRSVIMLLFVYIHYLFAKESDSLTALFSAVAVVMLISPSAVSDVGLWLSFLATLGIITTYSLGARYLKVSAKRGFWRGALKILRCAALALLLSFVCGIFTCFVVWMTFGEISLMSLVSNLVLTPISVLFLIAIPIGMIFARCNPVVEAIKMLAELMTYICRWISERGAAIISLGYGFAGVIIVILSAALLIMLVVNMKRKSLIFIPPIAAVVAFAVCLGAHNFWRADDLYMTYRRQGRNEMIVISESYGAAVIDISSGAGGFVKGASAVAKENYATEIEDFVLTHYHGTTASSVELLMGRILVRRICIPMPKTDQDARIADEIIAIAQANGCEISIYTENDTLVLLNDTRVRIHTDTEKEGALALFIANRDEAVAYIGAGTRDSEGAEKFSSLADYIIFGVHGDSSADVAKNGEDRNLILH